MKIDLFFELSWLGCLLPLLANSQRRNGLWPQAPNKQLNSSLINCLFFFSFYLMKAKEVKWSSLLKNGMEAAGAEEPPAHNPLIEEKREVN